MTSFNHYNSPRRQVTPLFTLDGQDARSYLPSKAPHTTPSRMRPGNTHASVTEDDSGEGNASGLRRGRPERKERKAPERGPRATTRGHGVGNCPRPLALQAPAPTVPTDVALQLPGCHPSY